MAVDPAADRVSATAQAVLDAVTGYYEVAGVELPERQLIFPGALPAWDCEFVGVGVERVFSHTGDIAVETIQAIGAHPSFAMHGAQLTVWVVRCTPVLLDDGSPPTVEALAENAALLLADIQLVHNAVTEATRPTATLATCNGVAFVDWQPVGPDGGFAGGVHRLRVSLI